MAAPTKRMFWCSSFITRLLSRTESRVDRLILGVARSERTICYVLPQIHTRFKSSHGPSHFGNVCFRVRNPKQHLTFPVLCPNVNNYTTLADRECWNCGRRNGFEEERFFCKCGIIQEVPADITYFDVLGVDRTFDLDLAELRRNFMQFQMKLHPDKYSQKSETEKQLADHQSAMVNSAYFTLLKPLSRGLHLLEQHGESLGEGTAQMDSEFLMKIMELNEQIAEANSREIVIQLGKDNEQMLQKMEEKLSDAFMEKNIPAAKHILQQMKYYDNLDKKIKELEREHGIVY